MNLDLEVQIALETAGLPADTDLRRWAETAMQGRRESAELVIRIVNEAESAALNQRYRHKQGSTNVLSFPYESPPGAEALDLLGDLVICAPVVAREAVAQNKKADAHWAHMIVHGVLHLLGYDHQRDTQALEMETLEARLLADLGYPSPYGDSP